MEVWQRRQDSLRETEQEIVASRFSPRVGRSSVPVPTVTRCGSMALLDLSMQEEDLLGLMRQAPKS